MTTSTITKAAIFTAIAVGGLTLGLAGQAQALTMIDTTNNPPWNGGNGVGYLGPSTSPQTFTLGQTFTVPVNGDTMLDNFTFFVNKSTADTNPNAVQFASYVMAWDGQKAKGSVLYQSGPQATNQLFNFKPFNFATGGLNLLAGQQYVAFLSASNFPSSALGFVGAVNRDSYSGDQVNLNSDTNFDAVTTFNWQKSNYDLAFQANFSSPSIPTPALLPGLIGMGVAMLRKHRSAEAGSEG
jgi:hypothetical protein